MLNSHQISSRPLQISRLWTHFASFKNSKWSSQIFQFKTLYWTILEDFSVKLNPAACIFLWLEAKIGLSRMISIYVVLFGSHFAGFASLPLSRVRPPRIPNAPCKVVTKHALQFFFINKQKEKEKCTSSNAQTPKCQTPRLQG
jgi:hypothetical protein